MLGADKPDEEARGFMYDDEFLPKEEGEFCKLLMSQMREVPWARGLIGNIEGNWKLSSRRELRSFLFELQIAHEIQKTGLEQVEYEPVTLGKSSVDFRVSGGENNCLIEAVSSKVSDFQKSATAILQVSPGITSFETCMCGGDIASEMILVQQRIGEKVVNSDGRPIKFPVPDMYSSHIIAIDMRCFGLGEGGDFHDYQQIAYGPNPKAGPYVVHLNGSPVLGLWQSPPQRATPFLRDRVHFIVFCNRKSFDAGLFTEKHTGICYNPHAFASIEEACKRLTRIPIFSGAVFIEAPQTE